MIRQVVTELPQDGSSHGLYDGRRLTLVQSTGTQAEM